MADRPDPSPDLWIDIDEADAPPRLTEREMRDILAESEADAATGRIVPWEVIQERVLAEIAAYEAGVAPPPE